MTSSAHQFPGRPSSLIASQRACSVCSSLCWLCVVLQCTPQWQQFCWLIEGTLQHLASCMCYCQYLLLPADIFFPPFLLVSELHSTQHSFSFTLVCYSGFAFRYLNVIGHYRPRLLAGKADRARQCSDGVARVTNVSPFHSNCRTDVLFCID